MIRSVRIALNRSADSSSTCCAHVEDKTRCTSCGLAARMSVLSCSSRGSSRWLRPAVSISTPSQPAHFRSADAISSAFDATCSGTPMIDAYVRSWSTAAIL